MLSPLVYSLVVMTIVAQRLGELSLASYHAKKLVQKGAYEIGEKNYRYMKILHSLFFLSLAGEALWHFDPPGGNFVLGMIVLLFLGQALRFYSITLLKERWTTKVFVVPGVPRIRRGIYRFFAHPNYLGVVLELFAIPALAGLWWTAGFFSTFNLLILLQRVKLEHQALTLSEKSI